jgi:glycosyltransferase involved in cell wall biosynthesis
MTARRTRVLHVIQNLNYGGMERVLSDLVHGCDPDRFESHVLCLTFLGRFSKGLEQVAELHVARPMSRLSMLRPASLSHDIARIAPDVVHTHSGVWYKGSLAAKNAGVPWIVHTEHGRRDPDGWPHRLVDGLAARRTDAIVAVSARLAHDLPRTIRAPATRVVCIPNGIDTDAYAPRPDTGVIRRELNIPPGAPIIGSVGRLEPIKTYDVMVRAFAEFARTDAGRDAALVIAGDGTMRRTLEKQIDDLGVRPRTHLLGWRDDVRDLFSAFSVFSMSSKSEGTSISLLEAMSSGLAPVVTDVGGNAGVLGPTLAHSLVPPGQPAALAAAWGAMLGDNALLTKTSKLARDRVLSWFSLAQMIQAYESLYQRKRAA